VKGFLEDLRLNAWRTAGARYEAARRLQLRVLFATISVAFFSASGSALVVVQRVYGSAQGPGWDSAVTVVAAVLGLLVLVLSLTEWGAGHAAKAYALFENAENLNAHQRETAELIARIDAGAAVDWKDVHGHRARYEEWKRQCRYNHDPIDDESFRARKRGAPEFRSGGATNMNWAQAAVIRARHWAASVWYFGLLWALVAAAIWSVVRPLLH
jgi:hypothetical protein